jgi:type I restriction enzyme R subunit
VDYLGIAADLKEGAVVLFRCRRQGRSHLLAQEQAVQLMLEKLEVVAAMYHGFAYGLF